MLLAELLNSCVFLPHTQGMQSQQGHNACRTLSCCRLFGFVVLRQPLTDPRLASSKITLRKGFFSQSLSCLPGKVQGRQLEAAGHTHSGEERKTTISLHSVPFLHLHSPGSQTGAALSTVAEALNGHASNLYGVHMCVCVFLNTHMALNSMFSCVCLSNSGVKGMRHHTRLYFYFCVYYVLV